MPSSFVPVAKHQVPRSDEQRARLREAFGARSKRGASEKGRDEGPRNLGR